MVNLERIAKVTSFIIATTRMEMVEVLGQSTRRKKIKMVYDHIIITEYITIF